MSLEFPPAVEVIRRLREVFDSGKPLKAIAVILVHDDDLVVTAAAPDEFSADLADELEKLAEMVRQGLSVDRPLN